MELQQTNNPNPIEHAKNLEDILSSLKSLMRNEIQVFHDPKAKALLETSAEVLGGLEKAFHDFVKKDDEVWKEEIQETPQKSSDPWD
jgi:hypothetical protein